MDEIKEETEIVFSVVFDGEGSLDFGTCLYLELFKESDEYRLCLESQAAYSGVEAKISVPNPSPKKLRELSMVLAEAVELMGKKEGKDIRETLNLTGDGHPVDGYN